MSGLWHKLSLLHVTLVLWLARFMALLNLSFALNRMDSPQSLSLERGRCMIGRGSGGESREKHHLDFQEDVRDTGQELHKNGHREVWQGLSQHGQGGGEYWDPAWVPCIFCSGPNSAGRLGGHV